MHARYIHRFVFVLCFSFCVSHIVIALTARVLLCFLLLKASREEGRCPLTKNCPRQSKWKACILHFELPPPTKLSRCLFPPRAFLVSDASSITKDNCLRANLTGMAPCNTIIITHQKHIHSSQPHTFFPRHSVTLPCYINSPAAASEALQDKHFAYLQGVPTHQLERLVKTAVSGVETAGVDTTFVLHAPQEDFTNADDDTIEVCSQVHLNPTALCWS